MKKKKNVEISFTPSYLELCIENIFFLLLRETTLEIDRNYSVIVKRKVLNP